MIFGCQERLSSVSTRHSNLSVVVFVDFHRTLGTRYEATPSSKSIRLSKGINGLSEVEQSVEGWWIFEDFRESGWLITKRVYLRFGDCNHSLI